MKLRRVGGSVLARAQILKKKPNRVKHAHHARGPNGWVICLKVIFLMKQGKDLHKYRGVGAEPPIFDISTLVSALPESSIEPFS